ncbi:MAG: hypothetical protein ABIZ49_07845 [Opitutaceae bacterium]
MQGSRRKISQKFRPWPVALEQTVLNRQRFLAGAPEADGVVRSLDGNRPVFDKATINMDLLGSYDFRFNQNKIRARVQLNVRNALEGGRLQRISVNPDGTPWNYRIIDPRQFILTTTFDL